MDKTNLLPVSTERNPLLRRRLEKLTHERCTGSDEYLDCAIGSLQTQAMAKALIEILFESSDVDGLDREIEDRLEQALERAMYAEPGDVG